MTKLIGVDPSMSGTGIVALEVTREAGLDRVKLFDHWTIRPPRGKPLLDRLIYLHDQVFTDLVNLEARDADPNRWALVAEDPTDFTLHPGVETGRAARYKSGAVLGAAVGAVLTGLHGVLGYFNLSHVVAIPSRTWLPKGGRGGSFMGHAQVVSTLRRFHPALKPCNDDETMAAGVALYWYRNQVALAKPAPRLVRRIPA